MIRVLLVDDHCWVREAQSILLNSTHDITVVGECTDGEAVVQAVVALRPDVVLMDVHMPTVSGLVATSLLKAAGLTIPVILTGSLEAGPAAQQAAAIGAAGSVPKGTSPGLLLQMIRDVSASR